MQRTRAVRRRSQVSRKPAAVPWHRGGGVGAGVWVPRAGEGYTPAWCRSAWSCFHRSVNEPLSSASPSCNISSSSRLSPEYSCDAHSLAAPSSNVSRGTAPKASACVRSSDSIGAASSPLPSGSLACSPARWPPGLPPGLTCCATTTSSQCACGHALSLSTEGTLGTQAVYAWGTHTVLGYAGAGAQRRTGGEGNDLQPLAQGTEHGIAA
jgi:hypothetical protein